MKNKRAFTLVELIVWITISMLLMVSVGVFVSTWMSNITLQKKVLEDNKKTSSDILYLQKSILNSKQYISNIWTNTWILLKQNKYFDKGWFSYIWVKEFDWKYCSAWEITKTNHLYVSNFIPLTNVNIDNWNNNWDYKSDISKHQILKKISWKWETIVWKDIFWDKFSEWDLWTDVFLNSPTWLVEIDWKIVFSDTLNDRVLYLSGSKVYTLLDEIDWVNEPIWLAYNSTEKALYIANAGKWEILKLSSKKYLANPDLEIKNVSENDVDKLKIEILKTTKILNGPNLDSDFYFSNITKNSWDDIIRLENNKINYYFLNDYITNRTRNVCNWKQLWDIILDYPNYSIRCTNDTGSWEIASFKNIDFNNTELKIKNIESLFLNNKNYYVKLNLFKDNDLKYSKYYSYFTQWDDDIFTKDDNTLEVKETWLFYPTWVDSNWNATDFDPENFNYSALKKDFIFSNPVKNLEISYSSNLLNLKLNYYKYLNCFNIDEKIDRNFLIKKSY